MPGRDGRGGLQFEHVGRQVVDRLLDALPSAVPTARPPSLASVGRLLAPPTYFCTRPIFDAGHVELRPPVELQFEVLLDLPVLLQQLQPAVAGDAVADVDHQVAFAEFEEAVDHPAQPPPRRARQVGCGGTTRRC